ncbi:MAG TPA: S41 family peptidase, partial [Gemmatimonadaceae bacterium]|nr:S41 family peptidase [Gemmatimonadaceae bacterium]
MRGRAAAFNLSAPSAVRSLLPGNIGYLRIDTFGSDSVSYHVRRAMTRLKDTDGLIVDLRYNGGGNTNLGLLAMLVDTAVTGTVSRARSHAAAHASAR